MSVDPHNAAKKAFELRSVILNERVRVHRIADPLTWSTIDRMTRLSKEITDSLTAVEQPIDGEIQ